MKKLKEEKELESNETECGTLMVYGIPGNLQKKGLENLFCVFGEIIYIDLNRPGGNDKSCSITMETLQQALSAQRSLNKAPPFFLNIRIKKGNGAFTKSVGSTSTVNPAVVHQISTVNPAVVHQISTIGPAVVDPTTTIDTAVVDPTITIDPAVVDPATTIDAVVDPTTTIDPAVVDPTTTIDPAVVDPTSAVDPAVVDSNTTIDPAVVDPTTTINPAVVDPTSTIDPAISNQNSAVDEAVVDPIITIDPAVVDPTTTINPAVVDQISTLDRDGVDPTPLDAGKQDSESRKSRKISEVEKEMDADTAANQLSALVILEEQISSDEEFYSFDSEEEETFSSSKGDEVIDPPTLDIQRPLPPAPSPPIKPLNFENERTEVQIIDGSDFPEVFYVMPAALANEKKRIELLLSAINRYDLENIKPRLKTSVLVEYSDRLYRANVIRIDHVYRWAQVELVDEGGLVDVSWDLCFSPLDRLWAEPSLAATVGLFIPEDELWPEKFNKQILSLISLEKIFVYVVPVVRVAGQLLVSISLERRVSKDIFAVIEDINTFRCAEDVISTHGDSDTGPAQGQGTDGVVDYTEHPLFFLEPPVAAGSEPMVPLEDFSDPPLAKSAPPEKHIHQDSECCRDAGINFSVLITDLEHTKVHDGASYLFIGFGEWSNIIYLVPMYDNISGSDFARLDSVLLESGLQPAIDRELEVGEVLVVPRQFYNRTKYIRAEVLKIYPSDPEKTVKIRGIDAQYRSIEKMVNLRPLTPDALLYPVKAIKVVLNNVSKHPRATFKPLISDLTSQMLNEPMIVHVIEPGNVPVVNLLSEVLPPVSLNLLVEDDLNDGKQTPGNPAPEPPAALLVEFGDDYEDVARAFIDLHKDSFCKIEVGSIGVVILHSESPDLVGFMPLDRALELEKCLEKYRQLASGTKFIDDQPEVGKVYLSRGKDGAWYRAAVLSLDKHQAKMLFLDFGFIEKVAATSLKLYNSDGLKFLTNFCRVENWNDDPLEEDWTCNKKSAANTRLRPLAKLKALEVECPPENQLQVVAVESPPGPADQLLVVAAEGSNTGGDDGGDLPQDRAELQRQRASRKREIRRQLPVWSPRVVEVLDTPGPLYTIRI